MSDYAKTAQKILDTSYHEGLTDYIHVPFTPPAFDDEYVLFPDSPCLSELLRRRDSICREAVSEYDELQKQNSKLWNAPPQVHDNVRKRIGTHLDDNPLLRALSCSTTGLVFPGKSKHTKIDSKRYAIARDGLSFAAAVLTGRVSALNSGESNADTLLIHPALAEDDRFASSIARIADEMECSYDERTSPVLDEDPYELRARKGKASLADGVQLPDICGAYRLVRTWDVISGDSVIGRQHDDPNTIHVSLGMLFPENIDSEVNKLAVTVERDMKQWQALPEGMNRLMTVASYGINDEYLPKIYQELIARAEVLLPIWIHILDTSPEIQQLVELKRENEILSQMMGSRPSQDGKPKRMLFLDYESEWFSCGGHSYLEALADGVPMEDVLV